VVEQVLDGVDGGTSWSGLEIPTTAALHADGLQHLVDLGLVYDLTSDHGKVHVIMTLTTPGCPMSDSMPPAVQRVIESIPGVVDVDVDLIWDPPWDPDRITGQGRRELGWLD